MCCKDLILVAAVTLTGVRAIKTVIFIAVDGRSILPAGSTMMNSYKGLVMR